MAEAAAWRNRPLDPMYPVVCVDALRVKIRGDGVVSNQAVYLALGIAADGSRDILRVIYTTNTIENLNMRLGRFIKTRGHFPNDEAATMLLWLAIRNVLAKTVRPTYDWTATMNRFAIKCEERFTPGRDLDRVLDGHLSQAVPDPGRARGRRTLRGRVLARWRPACVVHPHQRAARRSWPAGPHLRGWHAPVPRDPPATARRLPAAAGAVPSAGRVDIGPTLRALGDPNALAVLIAADSTVPYGEVVEVMNNMRAVGTTRVGLMVKGSGQ